MADRLLLESSATDGYLLEDGSGILYMEVPRCYFDVAWGDTPTAYFRLGEASGSPVDAKGGASGTITGTVTQGVAGALAEQDAAITFGGGYFSIPDSTAINPGDTFSLEFWVKRATLSTNQTILLKVGAYTVEFYAADHKVHFTDYGNVELANTSVSIADTTTWHHVVCTKATATSKIYIDGVDVTVALVDGTVTDSANDLYVGATNTGTVTLSGSLDELAFYAIALTPLQVQAHYNSASIGCARHFGPIVLQAKNRAATR